MKPDNAYSWHAVLHVKKVLLLLLCGRWMSVCINMDNVVLKYFQSSSELEPKIKCNLPISLGNTLGNEFFIHSFHWSYMTESKKKQCFDKLLYVTMPAVDLCCFCMLWLTANEITGISVSFQFSLFLQCHKIKQERDEAVKKLEEFQKSKLIMLVGLFWYRGYSTAVLRRLRFRSMCCFSFKALY